MALKVIPSLFIPLSKPRERTNPTQPNLAEQYNGRSAVPYNPADDEVITNRPAYCKFFSFICTDKWIKPGKSKFPELAIAFPEFLPFIEADN